MQRGYIKIWRKIEDSGLLQMHGTLALFMVMILRAAYKPCRVGLIDIDRGQLIAGRFQLCEWSGLSEQSTRTSVKHLHDLGMITSKPTNKFTIYTIVNYGQYQDYDDIANQQTNQQLTNNQPTTNQQLTTIKDIKTLSIKELKTNSTFVLPDFISSEDWNLWIKTRKGKKLNDEQKQGYVEKLEKWMKLGLDHKSALKDAALAGWQGLHEPKNGYSKSPKADNFENKDYGTGVNPL